MIIADAEFVLRVQFTEAQALHGVHVFAELLQQHFSIQVNLNPSPPKRGENERSAAAKATSIMALLKIDFMALFFSCVMAG